MSNTNSSVICIAMFISNYLFAVTPNCLSICNSYGIRVLLIYDLFKPCTLPFSAYHMTQTWLLAQDGKFEEIKSLRALPVACLVSQVK